MKTWFLSLVQFTKMGFENFQSLLMVLKRAFQLSKI